jgi:hypothetical protein
MSPVIHHWPIRKNVIVVAAATALPKGMIIPKTKKGIPSTGHFEDMHVGKFKGPPRRAFFNSDLRAKKQRTRATLRYRIVTITAAYELLGSTSSE